MTSLDVSRPLDSCESECADPQQQVLILGCMHGIQQCTELLQQLSELSFIKTEKGGSSIGAHLRHILDRYQCFFSGLESGCVDYDGRKRDQSIETSLEAATFAVASIGKRIERLQLPGSPLQIKESVHHLGPQVLVDSSMSRELMGLITHTTHHLAIIAMLARKQGYQLPEDFGKAPSTILHERS